MANKINASLTVDREAVRTAAEYAEICARDLEDLQRQIAKHIQFLMKEENISGEESEIFKKAANTAGKTVGTVSQRMNQIAGAFNKLVAAYGGEAVKAKFSFEEAKGNMKKVMNRIREQKR